MNSAKIHSPAGFTLVEMLLVIAILGILATLAAPSLSSFVESQRARATATDLDIALTRTRSEAIKQNADVTLSPKGGGWASGWQILDPATNGLIDDHAAVNGLSVSGPASVTYQSSGRLKGGAAPTFSISGSNADSARCVTADLSGRPLVKKGSC